MTDEKVEPSMETFPWNEIVSHDAREHVRKLHKELQKIYKWKEDFEAKQEKDKQEIEKEYLQIVKEGDVHEFLFWESNTRDIFEAGVLLGQLTRIKEILE